MCRVIVLVLAVLVAAVSPARANLVTNPGFETCASGQAADWDPSTPNPDGFLCSSPSHTGSLAAQMVGAGSLSQLVPTIAGHSYDFAFWLSGSGGLNPGNSFSAIFDGTLVLALSNTTLASYTLEEFTVIASQTNERVVFSGFNATGQWSLDDVSVTEIAAPEPASLTLLAGGLVGLWRVRRRA
jgi:hypothetical protein